MLKKIVLGSLQTNRMVFLTSAQQLPLIPCMGSLYLKFFRGYHSPGSYGVEAANAHVFEDLRKVYKSPELDILYSLQARYPEWTVTMAPAATGLIEYAKAGEATAILDTGCQKSLSRLKFEPSEKIRSAPEHQPGKYVEQVEFGR